MIYRAPKINCKLSRPQLAFSHHHNIASIEVENTMKISVNGNSRMAFGSGTGMKIKLRIFYAYVYKVTKMIEKRKIISH